MSLIISENYKVKSYNTCFLQMRLDYGVSQERMECLVKLLINKYLSVYGLAWNLELSTVSGDIKSHSEFEINKIFETCVEQAVTRLSVWFKKIKNISERVSVGLYICGSLFMVSIYEKTHGIVSFISFIVAVGLFYIPWWFYHLKELVAEYYQKELLEINT